MTQLKLQKNQPFSRRILALLLWALVASTLFICVFAIAILSSLDGLCGISEQADPVLSPDGNRQAIVYERNCGSTTGYTTHVSIFDANTPLPNEKGNVFILNGHPDSTEVELNWLGNRELEILYNDNLTIYRNRTRFWWVKMSYTAKTVD